MYNPKNNDTQQTKVINIDTNATLNSTIINNKNNATELDQNTKIININPNIVELDELLIPITSKSTTELANNSTNEKRKVKRSSTLFKKSY